MLPASSASTASTRRRLVHAADGRRRRRAGARRRDRRGRGRVLVQPAALAAGHPHPARRQAHDHRRPRRPGRPQQPAATATARPLRRRLNAASRLLSTLELRGLNQQVIDGRLPEAVGGEFADANGLGGPARRRRGPADPHRLPGVRREPDARVPLRGGAARRRLPRPRRAATGLRPQTVRGAAPRPDRHVARLLAGRCSATSAARSLQGARCADRRPPAAAAPPPRTATAFAMKRDVARALGISKLSDLERYWPPPPAPLAGARAAAPTRARPSSGRSPRTACSTCPARGSSPAAPGVTVAIVDSGARLEHPDLGAEHLDQLRRDARQRRRRRPQRLRRRRPRRRSDLQQPGQDLHDGHGHGTHVAGIVAAARERPRRRRRRPEAKLMIVKVLDDNGAGSTGARRRGDPLRGRQRRARDQPARSAATSATRALAEAVKAAADGQRARRRLRRQRRPRHRPAARLPGGDPRRQPARRRLHRPRHAAAASASFSNFGRLDRAGRRARRRRSSPPANDGGYEIKSGTSMAAPMVAGVAALAAGVNPQHHRRRPARRADAERDAGRGCRSPPATSTRCTACWPPAAPSATTPPQPPRLKILSATRTGRPHQASRSPRSGSTAAISRYRVTLGCAAVAQLAGRARARSPSPSAAAAPAVRVAGARRRRAGRVASGQRKVSAAAQGQARRRHRRRRRHMIRSAVLPRR